MRHLHLAKIFSLIVSLLGLLSFAISPVQAAGQASITVQMKDTSGNAVAGGQLSVYKVAEVKAGKYQYTAAFAKMDEDISAKTQSSVMTESFAQSLASYAAANEVSGQTSQISSSGEATLAADEQAVYLVTQTTAANGYEKIKPFTLVLPYVQDGQSMSQIIAKPKLEKTTPSKPETPSTPSVPNSSSSSSVSSGKKVGTKPQTPNTPTVTASTSSSSTSSRQNVPTLPQSPRLPQTGQLNWPIPLLALLGMTLFMWGWAQERKWQ
ncbi:hypothetical protein [Lactobacillus delbrueckii]|uniref:hypothetical protein n=1 Tax=Lactobacillus delbrueckii TaxID=1584 RepID=UPI0039935A2D